MNNATERIVLCCDAVEWLQSSDALIEGSVFTAIPDVKDVPHFNEMKNVIERGRLYCEWFSAITETLFRRLADGQVAIFSQTDAKIIDGNGMVVSWIDKSHLCSVAANKMGCTLLWHKIALNHDSEEGEYRPSYTHLLCFGKKFSFHINSFKSPDVLDRGLMTWAKATGVDSCIVGIAFLRNVVKTTHVFSPFCGKGTILAVANYFGIRALGIEICTKRARKSRGRDLTDVLSAIPIAHLVQLGLIVDVEVKGEMTASEVVEVDVVDLDVECGDANVDNFSLLVNISVPV